MVKLISVIGFVALLSGCGYDQSEVIAAKSACDAQSGEFKVETSEKSSGLILGTYCVIDNIQYRIGRSGQGFYQATLVK